VANTIQVLIFYKQDITIVKMEMSMRIGYLSTLYHTSFILKNRPSDYLENYPLHWTLYSTGPAIMEVFRRGEIDMGYIGLPPHDDWY